MKDIRLLLFMGLVAAASAATVGCMSEDPMTNGVDDDNDGVIDNPAEADE